MNTPHHTTHTHTHRSATGHVREVRFLDADVAAAQLSRNHSLMDGVGCPAPDVTPLSHAMRGQRWVAHVIFHHVPA